MSDILIKNMEIPKDYKYVDVRIFRDGWATTSSAEYPFYKKMDVFEVPTPHGRLIDADEMLQFLVETFGEEVKAGFAWKTISEHCITIIEAEGT